MGIELENIDRQQGSVTELPLVARRLSPDMPRSLRCYSGSMAKRLEPRPLRFPALLPKRGVYLFDDEEGQQINKNDGYTRVLAPMNLLAAILILATAVIGLLNKTTLGTKVLVVG